LSYFFLDFFNWLSVTPNQDILADAVQVQSIFAHPGINEDLLAPLKTRLGIENDLPSLTFSPASTSAGT